MNDAPPRSGRVAPAFVAFLATAAGYWLALECVLWLPQRIFWGAPGSMRVIGGLVMPGVLLFLGFIQRGRSPAVHAALVALAFAGALAETLAHSPHRPDAAALALVRMMTYAYAGAALHAAVLNATLAFHAPAAKSD
jgi:hypothetical protein